MGGWAGRAARGHGLADQQRDLRDGGWQSRNEGEAGGDIGGAARA